MQPPSLKQGGLNFQLTIANSSGQEHLSSYTLTLSLEREPEMNVGDLF